MRKLLVICYFLVGCTTVENQDISKPYYDLAGFLNQQVKLLTNKQPLTEKTFLIEDKTEVIQTKEIDWKKELELFYQIDLNKQSYQQSYKQENQDSVVTYRLKKGENLPVKFLKIELDNKKAPKHIEAEVQTSNYLFGSSRRLTMDINQEQINSYQIDGWQKLFIGEKKSYSISANIK